MCGEQFIGTRRRKYCSQNCANTISLTKWKDLEVIYLASINRGFGFKNFVNTIYSGGWDRNRTKILGILLDFKEETGNDYYAHLQDPAVLDEMTALEYRKRFSKTRVPKGQSSKIGSKKAHQNIVRTDKNLRFNWGQFADDPRAKHDEEE